jgi:hypothetical protein
MNCTEYNMIVPGTIDSFFTALGLSVCGFFAGFVAIATLVYKPPKPEPESEPEHETPYEQKYYDEFSEMDERELKDEEIAGLKENFICEITPYSDVIICYNKDQESFDVWHDDRNIPFKILDAVAQHYTIENNVKAICVDYKYEYHQAVAKMNEAKEKKEDNDEEEEKKVDNVFASFKTYNKASEKGKSVDNKIVTGKCNRFRRVGNIKDWHDVYDKKDESVGDSSKKQLSYEVFKAMHKSTKPTDVASQEDKKEK